VISASDSYARSVYNNFSKRGFVLHQDYGVAGIGGLGIAYCEKPFLTTIKIDAVEIGRMAVKCLLRRISSASGAPMQIYSPPAFFECGETL
jgi:Transcriptional regulators